MRGIEREELVVLFEGIMCNTLEGPLFHCDNYHWLFFLSSLFCYFSRVFGIIPNFFPAYIDKNIVFLGKHCNHLY